jgi:DNA-binding FadR family transcriptional regulator
MVCYHPAVTLVVQGVERETLSGQVVRQLSDMIVARQVEPGSLLPPEKALAENFGVSRMVIRESVRILAALGLVDVRHGVGTFVNPASVWRTDEPLTLLFRAERQSLLHWLELRRVVETGFAELAARRATAENLVTMAAALELMRSGSDASAVIAADLDFHLELARATANPLALTMIRPVLRPLHEHLVVAVGLPRALERAIAEHESIRAAIAARDAEAAAMAMRAHLDRVRDEIEMLHRREDPPVVGAHAPRREAARPRRG